MNTPQLKNSFLCQSCGQTFIVPQAALQKYPGWIPAQCLRCRDKKTASKPTPMSPIEPQECPPMSSPKETKTTSHKEIITPPGLKQHLEKILQQHTSGPTDGIFTDGACAGNPGPGGWGAVYVRQNQIITQDFGYEPKTTNNRMELTALIAGFQMIDPDTPITVWSDSQLCVNTLNLWVSQWERNGWRRKGGPIKNLELVQELYRLAKAHPHAQVCWIKAHNGYRWNEYVDALSTAYLRNG